jgi:hypothetical protein
MGGFWVAHKKRRYIIVHMGLIKKAIIKAIIMGKEPPRR